MSVSETLSPVVGRLVFGWFFFTQVAMYAGNWDGTIEAMRNNGVPGAAFLLALVLLVMTMGALSLIFGFHTRYGALILFIVTVIAMVSLHDYWRIYGSPSARGAEFELFACHAAIAGGLLMLIGMGPGPIAVDNNKGGGKKK